MGKANIAEGLIPLAQPIESLSLLPGNPRKGDISAVKASYARFGQRKPIVATRDGTVIAGNHQLQAARALGWDEIAVVYVDDDDQTAKAFALADNRTSDLGTYDDVALLDLIDELSHEPELLAAAGYTKTDIDALLADIDSVDDGETGDKYTGAINVPQYEIVGEEPSPADLYDDTKLRDLHHSIETVEMPDEVRGFLRLAAYRHVVFNYRRIAEFYPHQTVEVQRLMEQSALVIIDFDDAMRNGYVKMSAFLETLRKDTDA